MTIYKVDKIIMDAIKCKVEEPVLYEAGRWTNGFYVDLNTAKRHIFNEIQRIHDNAPTSIQEIENVYNKPDDNPYFYGYRDRINISSAHFIYICDTAVNDGSKFIFIITDIYVNEDENKPYRGRKIIIEKGEL